MTIGGVCEILFLVCLYLSFMFVLVCMGVCLCVFVHVLILCEDTCIILVCSDKLCKN